VDTVTTKETLDPLSKEFSEGQLGDINEESGCDKKDEDVPEEVVAAKPHIKRTLRDIVRHQKCKG
jgi:hypothetical protein